MRTIMTFAFAAFGAMILAFGFYLDEKKAISRIFAYLTGGCFALEMMACICAVWGLVP